MALKFIIVALATLVGITAARQVDWRTDDTVYNDRSTIVTRNFTSRLNHFPANPNDRRPIELTYTYTNLQRNGPLFVLINSGKLNASEWLQRSLVREAANRVNGSLVTLTTRYFGGPIDGLNDTSFVNLQYLRVDQILADIALFTGRLSAEYNASRVILFGEGFDGTIATWARQTYPHLIYGVWSSGGIFNHSIETNEPYQALEKSITLIGGNDCASDVQKAFREVVRLYDLSGANYIRRNFNWCETINTKVSQERIFFYQSLINYLVKHINEEHSGGIHSLCQSLKRPNFNETIDQTFGRWARSAFSQNGQCIGTTYNTTMENVIKSTWNSRGVLNGDRQRWYLQCIELLTYPIIDLSFNNIFYFYIPFNYYDSICRLAFPNRGYDYFRSLEGLKNLTLRHGTIKPGVTRVIFSNGLLDINYNLGITRDNALERNYIINIPGVGQASDVFGKNQDDDYYLSAAKEAIKNTLIRWATEQ